MNILALDVGGTAIKTGLINENGEILQTEECPTIATSGGANLMNQLLDIINSYKNIDRIGISATGQIDSIRGMVIHATDNIPGWTGVNIKRSIEDRFKIPTVVENDVNCAALGEAYFGAGKTENNFLCITYGTGIGGAIIENRKIYTGEFFSAGEFGHMITHKSGEACICGGYGCYEAYASTTALCRLVQRELNVLNINGREIFRLHEKNNIVISRLIDLWIDEIIVGLISLIHIFNPSCIILGGGIMTQSYITKTISEELPKHIMPNYRRVKIMKAELGNNAGILGAAQLAFYL